MTRTIIAAIAIGAFACGLPAFGASKHHAKHRTDAHAEVTPTMKASDYPPVYNPSGVYGPSDLFSAKNHASDQIPGVNPMANSPVIPAAPNKQPFVAVPGVNPM